jgi:hypothetical protein
LGGATGRAPVVLSVDSAEEIDLEPGEVLVALIPLPLFP